MRKCQSSGWTGFGISCSDIVNGFRILAREFVRLAAKDGRLTAVIFLPLLVWRRLRNIDSGPVARPDPSGAAFDQRYGVDTCGVVPMAHLAVVDTNWVHGFGYQPILPDELDSLWLEFDIDFRSAAFVDLGAGKGRALMLASQHPFKRIIGVEIAEELVEIARTNLQSFDKHEGRSSACEIICADAASYRFPPEPLFLYLYNPFDAPIMRKVIANLVGSFISRPRRIVVAYFRPELAEMWDLAPEFVLTRSSPRLRVYDNRTTLENSGPMASEMI